MKKPTSILSFDSLDDRSPTHSSLHGLDLVVIRYDDNVSVLYGRCLHRGALMADGYIDGDNIICGVHNWDYRFDTGVSAYDNSEVLFKFQSKIEDIQLVQLSYDNKCNKLLYRINALCSK